MVYKTDYGKSQDGPLKSLGMQMDSAQLQPPLLIPTSMLNLPWVLR
jgi:hypothetical protein